MKKICFWAVCVILWGTGSICADAGTMTVTDMAGREVAVPFDPERIVCIGPGALRIIVYLQAESKVVGVEEMEKMNPRGRPYWLAHPELGNLPRCGPGGPISIDKKPDLEAVLSVSPQVIFVTYMKASLAHDVQQTLRIPVVVLSYGAFATFDDTVYDSLRLAGKILNRSKRADDVAAYVESLRNDLAQRTMDIPEGGRPTAYIGGIGYRGAHGIESTEQEYAPFEWVHADNVAKPLKASVGTHAFVDKEMLLKLNPNIVFVDGGGYSLVAQDYRKNPSYYQALKAFSNQRVYTLLPFNWYVTNIGTALADAFAVGKILYEDRFEGIDPEPMADKIYTFLVGKPVYKEMKKDYGAIGRKAPFLN
ncbi:MAG: iron complex transport system substrate-binding protein [Thermodesulfobacteriota bacterium]|nr:iron complex transport system substrate-binding protein [Thermodesulfobacteriota bacterium]